MLSLIHTRSRLVLSFSCLLTLVCSSVMPTASAQPAVDDPAIRKLKEGEAWKVGQYATSERELALALISAKTNEEQRAILTSERELITAELVRELVLQGRRLADQNAYSVALNTFELALSLAEQLHDPICTATALRGLGYVHATQNNHKSALEHFQKSLKISRDIGDKPGIINSLHGIALMHSLQGNYSLSLEHSREGLKVSQEIGDKMGLNNALLAVGIAHASQGNYPLALEHFQKSLKISRELDHKPAIANVLNNIGLVHYFQSNYILALEHSQKSLRISRELGQPVVVAYALGLIGTIHDAQGNYIQSLEHYRELLKIGQEVGRRIVVVSALNSIGVVHYLQGNYALALEHFQKSLKIGEEIEDRRGVAAALQGIGNAHNSQGNHALALEHFQKSLKIGEEVGDRRGIAAALQSIGMAHNSQGNYTRALEHFQRSLKISRELDYKDGIADTLTGIGMVYCSQGNYSLARDEFAKAIAAVEELRGRVAGDEQQQQRFFQTRLSPYHQIIRLLIIEKKYVEAFAYAERVKGRALLDTLEAGRVDVTKAMTEDERAEEQKLNAEVVSLNTQIYRENLRGQPNKAVLIELQALREKARTSYEAFQINLYAAHPGLKIQRGEMQPVSLAEADKLIPNAGTAIAQYVVTEDLTYLFVLTKAQQSQVKPESSASIPTLNVYTINIKQKELAERVNRLHSRLSQKDIDFSKSSRELYDLLIGPALADLKNKSDLIVVPDGVLWQVPFQALQPSADRFLIQDYTISYAPSLTVLREMMRVKQKRQPASGGLSTLVAFANPDFDPTRVANLQAAYPEVLADEKLLPLPQTEDMVKTLSRLYTTAHSKVYVRAEASEDQAKREAGACRILQFATHGIVDNTNPMYSRLVLSQSGVDEHEDGMLEAWEVMKLDLKAEMVILSACDTARGRVAGGEGMIGLAWAFFVAGCPTTVVSQWAVEVNSTAELMVEFHKALKPSFEGSDSGVSKAGALRKAARKLMESPRYRHPFYWAPFVVIGDGR